MIADILLVVGVFLLTGGAVTAMPAALAVILTGKTEDKHYKFVAIGLSITIAGVAVLLCGLSLSFTGLVMSKY